MRKTNSPTWTVEEVRRNFSYGYSCGIEPRTVKLFPPPGPPPVGLGVSYARWTRNECRSHMPRDHSPDSSACNGVTDAQAKPSQRARGEESSIVRVGQSPTTPPVPPSPLPYSTSPGKQSAAGPVVRRGERECDGPVRSRALVQACGFVGIGVWKRQTRGCLYAHKRLRIFF